MGTINYGTSKFITVGLNTWAFEDGIDDEGNIVEGSRYDLMDDIKIMIERLLEDSGIKDDSAYTVKIESGYYEGFYINITDEYLYFDDEEDREEAREQLTAIFDFLNKTVDNGLCVVYPGWVTSYLNYEDSKKALETAYNQAIVECNEKPDYEKYQQTDEYRQLFKSA